jgi:hypothetical protein
LYGRETELTERIREAIKWLFEVKIGG